MAISIRVAPEIKLKAVKEYSAGEGSLNRIAAKYGVSRSTLQKWLLNYELFGESGLRHRVQNQHYPEVMKRQAVEAYLSGKCIEAVCKKFRIRSRTQLEQWIVLYNGQRNSVPLEGTERGLDGRESLSKTETSGRVLY